MSRYQAVIPGDTMTVEMFVTIAVEKGCSNKLIKEKLECFGVPDKHLGRHIMKWDMLADTLSDLD